MDVLTVDRLRSLTKREGSGPCVSLFLDTHATAPGNRQDALTLKTLIKSAERQLAEAGVKPPDAAALLAPARALADDGLFWRPQPGGVAIFLAAAEPARIMRLPVAFKPEAVVNERFHVKPLLGAVDRGEHYYVLALSQKDVRLFAGGRVGLEPVALGEMPRNILDTLRNDGFEEQLQLHSSSFGPKPGASRGSAIFHGSGPDTGITTRYLTEYVKRIAAGLRDFLREPDALVVLAAVDYLATMYREVDRAHRVAGDVVAGNPETLGVAELHARSWPIAERALTVRRRIALTHLRDLLGTPGASDDAAKVTEAAAAGRVATLFLQPSAMTWGRLDAELGSAEWHSEREPGDEDLADLAAVSTLLHGGEVWTAKTLAAPMAAILRY